MNRIPLIKKQQGFSLIELLVVVIIIGIIAAIAIPSLLGAKKNANEASAVQSLRTIHSANVAYFATVGNYSYGTLTQLSTAKLVDATFTGASFTKSGYTIAESTAGQTYCTKATPQSNQGRNSFGIDQTGVIFIASVDTDIDCTAGVLTTGGTAVVY